MDEKKRSADVINLCVARMAIEQDNIGKDNMNPK